MPNEPKAPETPSAPEHPGLQRLLNGTHANPHGFLGCHPDPAGCVVRAYRPDADAVCVVPDKGAEAPLGKIHPAGIFEGTLPLKPGTFGYRLKVTYGKEAFLVEDPYRFLPTLGDMDLHLFNEGNHEELHDRFGARTLTHQGVEGTAFTVWAPNAEGVSVVGDFNR